MTNSVKILSMNCRGLNGKQKRRDVIHYLRGKNASIICLQDVHFEPKLEMMVKAEWGGDAYFSSYASNSRGVAILLHNMLDYKVYSTKVDKNGNWVILDISINSIRVTLVSIYGPNEDNPDFYENIKKIVEEFDNAHCIFCGDWNLVQDQELDTSNYIRLNNPKARESVINMKNDLGLMDPWRFLHPKARRFTWRQPTPLKQARLDFFLISEELTSFPMKSSIEPGYRTDHSVITLTLEMTNIKHGKGFWKFNNLHLKDLDYLRKMREKINEVKKQYSVTPYNFDNIDQIPGSELYLKINDQLFLEVLLMEIRGETIKYASKKKRENIKRENALEKDIERLEEKIANSNTSSDLLEIINAKKIELEEIRQEKIKGVMLRSKARWVEHGEKPTSYFLNLEKRNYVNKSILHLKNAEGDDLRDGDQIMNETFNFYSKLYESKESDDDLNSFDQHFLRSDFPHLCNDQSQQLEGHLKYNELLFALKNAKQ